MVNSAKYPVVFDELIGEEININITYSDTRRTLYCEESNRYTDEKYILTVSGKTVNVECSGEKSAFYALCDIAKRMRENTLCDGEYVCVPSFCVRGYIEGFYGTPWSHEQRLSVMNLMAKNRMNTVYYAPKDDIYHRDLWRDLYPEADLLKLKELVDLAAEYYMDFYWCVAPGLSMKYSDEKEFDALLEKTKQLYSIGIRNFGLLLDDIAEDLYFAEDKALYGETVNAHISLIGKYYNALLAIDESIKLTICPTLYHGAGNEYYIAKLGRNISPRIAVFWTGKDICSREITSSQAVKFIEGTYHKPLYWDNYPVNDCAMYNEMHISPIIGRDADLYKYSEGIISNCMEYAECSKIPLITFADYLWDSRNYNSELSWENAVKQVIGEKDAENFIVFADHLYTSCLLDGNSRRMNGAFRKIAEEFREDRKENALALYSEYLGRMKDSSEFLRSDLPICKELTKWSEKYFVKCEITEKLFEYLKSEDEAYIAEIHTLVDKYNSMPARISKDVNIRTELQIFLKMLK